MWGTLGSGTGCGSNSVITGYVTMAVGVDSDVTATSDCSLTSNAKTQWAFTTLATNGYAGTAASQYSVVYLNGAEEYYCGGDTSACATAYTQPVIWAVGGCTYRVTGSMGLGAWTIYLSAIDINGDAEATWDSANEGVNGANSTFNIAF